MATAEHRQAIRDVQLLPAGGFLWSVAAAKCIHNQNEMIMLLNDRIADLKQQVETLQATSQGGQGVGR